MSYATLKAQYQRTLIRIIEIDLDICGNTFGNTPCNATGTPLCYNTYRTCRDGEETEFPKANFDRDKKTYKFSYHFTESPFFDIRPYIKNITNLPQEISATLQTRGRISVEMIDEPDTDIGIDLNWDARNTTINDVPGTFWKKLVARNPNYKNKPIRIKEGFVGLAYNNYVTIWTGIITNIEFGNGIVTIDGVDTLRSLDNIKLPGTSESYLAADINATQTASITLTGTVGVDSSGYIWFDNEIILYTSISANVLVGVQRGMFGTMRASHKAGSRVGRTKVYTGNPFIIMTQILISGGIEYDGTAFTELSNNAIYTLEPSIAILLIETTPLSKIFYELVEAFDCKTWTDETGQVTIRRNTFYDELPSYPSYITGRGSFNDEKSFIRDSFSVNLNEESKYTRINFYWNLDIYEVKRTLSGNINNSVTTIGLTSIEGLPETGEVLIGTEYITYSGVDFTALTITSCIRGQRSSTAASHSAGDEVKTTTLKVLREVTNPENFANVTQTVDVDAEYDYNEAILKTVFTRFFNNFNSLPPLNHTVSSFSTYIDTLTTKWIASKRDAQTEINFELEEKDTGLKIGDFLNVSTKNIEDVDGEAIEDVMYQVTRKEPDFGKAKYKAEKVVAFG